MDPMRLGLLLAVLAALIVLFLILFLKKKTVCFLLNADTEYLRVQVKRGGKLLRPADPTREGFRFGGWFRDAACTQPWNFDIDTVTSGLQLYARWEGDAQ